eukprot:GHVS01000447.1.p1 GENE.GHVS01000447.1~~GHVS01000447.1.p1  ORF type:complete len:151 (+),score=47.76 GHVS01000447.1:180-632(+)
MADVLHHSPFLRFNADRPLLLQILASHHVDLQTAHADTNLFVVPNLPAASLDEKDEKEYLEKKEVAVDKSRETPMYELMDGEEVEVVQLLIEQQTNEKEGEGVVESRDGVQDDRAVVVELMRAYSMSEGITGGGLLFWRHQAHCEEKTAS